MRKVSSRMPQAMAKPNWNSSRIGWVIRTAKVAARMRPAEEMTPPVRVSAAVIAFAGGWVRSSCLNRLMMKML